MTLSLKQLETFVSVADLASFKRAAQALNTTQPNISSRIAALESEVGTALMERDAGSVRLTAQGEDLLRHARNVLISVDDFLQAANGEAAFDGIVRLGVTEMVVHTWLRDFMQTFKARFPNALIELSVDLSINLESALAERDIDVAFQSGPFARRSSGEASLGRYPIIWTAAPSLGLTERSKMSAKRLSAFPILTHARNTRPYEDVNAHFAQWPQLKTRLVPSTNLSACMQMTLDGYGIAALLEPMVEREIANGQLLKLNYAWQPEPLNFAARYDLHRSSKVIHTAVEIAEQAAKNFDQRKSYKPKHMAKAS